MTGADIIVKVLAQEGVDTIFGYSGGAILPTYDAIFRYNTEQQEAGKPIELVVPANEQGAGFMAAGYARASGKVGVCLVTSGPGATNTVTPIRDCMSDSVPVVLITGQVPRHAIGTDAFQEAPIFNIMSSCAKRAFLVLDPEELEATIRTAFMIARSDRPGPVVIDIPKDVQTWNGTFRGEGVLNLRGYSKRIAELQAARIPEESKKAFFAILEKSRRPLIYAGGGIVKGDASNQLRCFSKMFNIPVVTTLQGIGSVDTTDSLSMGMLGMHGTAFANYAVEDCDFLIALGARFDDRVAGNVPKFAPNARNIAHIDIDASEIGKVKHVTWSHVGDVQCGLIDLIAAGEGVRNDTSAWLEHVRDLKNKHSMNYDRETPLIQPHYVLECLNELTQGEAIITTGVGQHQMWAAQWLDYKHPRTFLTSGSMGTMGFGLPAAIGAQLAYPDKLVIAIDGDGSLRMNLGEMETVTNYGLPLKIVLLNNQGDGMVRQWQKLFFSDRFCGTEKYLHRKDFIKSAEADGFYCAIRVTEKDGVKESLRRFLEHDGPSFIEVMIDPDANVYPMVGPGMSYKAMVTGDHISKREETVEAQKGRDLF